MWRRATDSSQHCADVPVQGIDANIAAAGYGAGLEPRGEQLFQLSGVRVRQALLDSFGDGAARARFSRMKARSSRGEFYGVTMDGNRYIAILITDPADLRNYEFFWDGPGGLTAIAGVRPFAENESRRREGGVQPHYL